MQPLRGTLTNKHNSRCNTKKYSTGYPENVVFAICSSTLSQICPQFNGRIESGTQKLGAGRAAATHIVGSEQPMGENHLQIAR